MLASSSMPFWFSGFQKSFILCGFDEDYSKKTRSFRIQPTPIFILNNFNVNLELHFRLYSTKHAKTLWFSCLNRPLAFARTLPVH